MFSSYAYIYIHKIKEMFVYIYIISGSIRCFPWLQDLARLKIALKHFGPRPKKFAGPWPILNVFFATIVCFSLSFASFSRCCFLGGLSILPCLCTGNIT